MSNEEVLSNAGYAEHAETLFRQYQSFKFDSIHRRVLNFFPKAPALILDVGAGSGRDAAHLVGLGHTVTAVEPTIEFVDRARTLHIDVDIDWVIDGLPYLSSVVDRDCTFELILLSAVWMHLDEHQRAESMKTLSILTHSGSIVIMSLRHGPIPKGRIMFEVFGDETSRLARRNGFSTLFEETSDSTQEQSRRSGISWTKIVLRRD